MKPLERIFFMACLHKQVLLPEREISFADILYSFVHFGFNLKQLHGYMTKWKNNGFFIHNELKLIDTGRIDFDKLIGEYKAIYDNNNIKSWNAR